MSANKKQKSSPQLDNGTLTLRFDGGKAANGALDLGVYAISLNGWKEFFRILAGIYQHSAGEIGSMAAQDALHIDIVAERQGSYEVLIEFGVFVAAQVVATRAFPRLN